MRERWTGASRLLKNVGSPPLALTCLALTRSMALASRALAAHATLTVSMTALCPHESRLV